jgi:molybdate transport system permease protein
MINPIKNALENFDKNLINAAYTLGKSKFVTFWYVILPNIKNSIITAIVTTFAHTMGEFGVVLMIGGNIPEKTQVASIAVYEYIENLDYKAAHIYSFILLFISLITLFIVYYFQNKSKNKII